MAPPTVPTPEAAAQMPQPMAAVNPSPAASPDAAQAPGGTGLPGVGQTQTQTPGVADRLPNIVNKSGVLGRMAMTRGKQYANQRGLLNSSLAADASHRALLDYAVPIAQADTNVALADADRRSREVMGRLDRESQERISAGTQATQSRIAEADRRSRERVSYNQLSVARSEDISNALSSIQSSHDRQYQAIMLSTKLTDDSRADQVASLQSWVNRQITLVEGVYGVDLEWDSGEEPAAGLAA